MGDLFSLLKQDIIVLPVLEDGKITLWTGSLWLHSTGETSVGYDPFLVSNNAKTVRYNCTVTFTYIQVLYPPQIGMKNEEHTCTYVGILR